MSFRNVNFYDLEKSYLDQFYHFVHELGKIKPDDEETFVYVSEQELRTLQKIKPEDFVAVGDRADAFYSELEENIGRIYTISKFLVDGEKQRAIRKEATQLQQELRQFKVIVGHHDALDKGGLEPFLNQAWAKKEFQKLIEQNHPWARAKLEELLRNNEELGFEMIILVGHDKKHLRELFFRYFEHPSFIERVEKKLLSQHEEDKKLAYAILETILTHQECQYAYRLLMQERDQTDDTVVEKLMNMLVNIKRDHSDWLQQELINSVEVSKPWVFSVVYNYLRDRKSEEFMKKIIAQSAHKSDLFINLAALCTLLEKDHPFTLAFQKAITTFDDLIPHFPNFVRDPREAFERLRGACRDIAVTIKKHVFNWKESSLLFKINFLRLFIKSEQSLLLVLKGAIDFKELIDPPVAKCFPKIKAAMLGFLTNRNEAPQAIVMQLADVLKAYEIPLYFQYRRSFHLNIKSMWYPLNCKLDFWIQDSFFIQERSLRYPALIAYSDENASVIKAERNKRLFDRALLFAPKPEGEAAGAAGGREKTPDLSRHMPSFDEVVKQYPIKVSEEAAFFPPFGVQVAVSMGHKQFSFLEFMMQYDKKVDRQRILFTHNEGGNCLIGEHEGKRFAIIGKDALTLNRKLLSEKLASIGLNKNEDGIWEMGNPYKPSECKISDEDITFLISLDMGLESPQQVYWVEQPEFHLDMGMALIGGKKVILSDSRMAAETLKEFVEHKFATEKVEEKYKKAVLERLALFEDSALVRKIFEDAAEKDLIDQGFEVIRVGGILKDITSPHPDSHRINFFNFVSLISPAGKKIVLAMGCEKFFQAKLEAILREHVPDLDQIHFLDQGDSEALLLKDGGIHCCMKLISQESSSFEGMMS